MTTSLLPPQSTTALENAVSVTSAESRPIPYERLKTIWDPWECPEEFLPFLAAALSVDIYENDWPLEKRRHVVAKAKEHNRARGSEWLVGEYAALVGGTLEQYITAPQGVYAVDGWTDEERAEYLSRLSYIRIHRHYPVDIEADGFFPDVDSFFDVDFLESEPSYHGYRKHAVLVSPDGTETDLTLDWQQQVSEDGVATELETIVLPAEPDAGFYCDTDFWDEDFLDIERIKERTIQIETRGAYHYEYGRLQHGFVFPQGLKVSVEPELITETAVADLTGTFLDIDFLDDTYLMPDDAWQQVYERYWIHDPSVIMHPIEIGGCYFDDAWFDWPPFLTQAHVELLGKQPEYGADEFWDVGFFLPPELDDYNRLIDAIEKAGALREDILLQTATHRWPTFGDRLPMDGSWAIGEMIKDR